MTLTEYWGLHVTQRVLGNVTVQAGVKYGMHTAVIIPLKSSMLSCRKQKEHKLHLKKTICRAWAANCDYYQHVWELITVWRSFTLNCDYLQTVRYLSQFNAEELHCVFFLLPWLKWHYKKALVIVIKSKDNLFIMRYISLFIHWNILPH